MKCSRRPVKVRRAYWISIQLSGSTARTRRGAGAIRRGGWFRGRFARGSRGRRQRSANCRSDDHAGRTVEFKTVDIDAIHSYQDRSRVLEALREGARQDGGVPGADPTGDRHPTQLEGGLLNGSRIGVRQDSEVDVTSAEIALRHQPAQDRG